MTKENNYDASSIVALEGLEPVRVRPAMYIGGTDKSGYHHLLWEIIDNSVDEAVNGYASQIEIILDSDRHGVAVIDNGRGIPVDTHEKTKKSALELILCTLHSGGKFSDKNYSVSGGLHGVGSSVVNALSQELIATIRRDGKEYQQKYKQGKPQTKVTELGPSKKRGTEIYFKPDPTIFNKNLKFDIDIIKERIETKSYLHKNLKFIFKDLADNSSVVYQHPNGINEYINKIITDKNKKPVHKEIFSCVSQDPRLEVVLSWTEDTDELIKAYANGIPNPQGGTHENGLKAGLSKAIRSYMASKKLEPKGLTIAAEDIREGLVAIISIYISEPQFQGQTKDRLNNTEVTSQVDNIIKVQVEQWLLQNPTIADSIIARIILSARAREASRASQQVTRKTATTKLNLPGKLADCSSDDPKVTELFLVEGDSAGGNAKMGRDRKTQAILPLRGKVLNVEKTGQALNNKELLDLISALGCGQGKDFNISKLRYGKIILLMDADSDGAHISTLLLTFFYRLLPGIIKNGNLFIALPPLYRIDSGKETYWALDDQEKEQIINKLPKNSKVDISRFKGLGEMSAKELKETTLDINKRKLLKVIIDSEVHTDQVINDLMGKDPEPRFNFIMANSKTVDYLDI